MSAAPEEASHWAPAHQPQPACAGHRGPGRFDEQARRVRHEELRVARLLVGEGHDVVALPERRGGGPVADFTVCGTPVEVKCLEPRSQRRDARPANDRSAFNALRRGVDQAPVTILTAEGSGLRAADAAAGLRRFAEDGRIGRTRSVRIVGDGFDLSWSAGAGVTARAEPIRHPAGRTGEDRRPGIGLG